MPPRRRRRCAPPPLLPRATPLLPHIVSSKVPTSSSRPLPSLFSPRAAASLRARIAALEAAFPGADVRSLVVSQPEVLTHDVARVRLVADAVRAAGKAIPGWIDANPSLVLKLMQSDAAFYYVLDMPAEVTRQSGGGSRGKGRGGGDGWDDDEPVWTKVGVFPSRPKR